MKSYLSHLQQYTKVIKMPTLAEQILSTRLIPMRTSVSYTIYIIFLYSNILKENKIDAKLPVQILVKIGKYW
jgi:hypothetical protein